MSEFLKKYREIRQHRDPDRVAALQGQLGKLDRVQLDQLYAGSRVAGHVFLQESPGEPACVLETVMSLQGDSVSSLYVANDLFFPRRKFVDAREDLIKLLEDISDSPPGQGMIRCPVRNRGVLIKELTFMQLLDTLKFIAVRAH